MNNKQKVKYLLNLLLATQEMCEIAYGIINSYANQLPTRFIDDLTKKAESMLEKSRNLVNKLS